MPTATDTRELTVTRKGVELVSVGTWDASTGRTRVTTTDLAAMIAAAEDPHYDIPAVKVGHDDDRFQDAAGNPPSTRDGQPAYGWVENLRLSDDGKTLIGDLVGVPTMLADVMDTALRRRSVELVRHERVGGKVYPAVLTGLALLGVQAPAVKGLADLRALFADQLARTPERFSLQITDDTPSLPQSAFANPERDRETTRSNQGAAMKLNDMQRKALGIADGATDDEIAAALAKMGLKMLAAEEEAPPQALDPAPAASTTAPAPVPAAGVNYAPPPAAALVPAPAPAAAPAPAPVPVAAAPAFAPVAEPTPQAVAASAATLGLQVVDTSMFAQLQHDAAAGRAARDEQDRLRRDALIQNAVKAGKVAPTAFAQMRSMADSDEDGVIKLLAAMPAIEAFAAPTGHGEQYSGGLPGDADDQAAAVARRRASLYDAFGLQAPVAATSKG